MNKQRKKGQISLQKKLQTEKFCFYKKYPFYERKKRTGTHFSFFFPKILKICKSVNVRSRESYLSKVVTGIDD